MQLVTITYGQSVCCTSLWNVQHAAPDMMLPALPAVSQHHPVNLWPPSVIGCSAGRGTIYFWATTNLFPHSDITACLWPHARRDTAKDCLCLTRSIFMFLITCLVTASTWLRYAVFSVAFMPQNSWEKRKNTRLKYEGFGLACSPSQAQLKP